MSLQVGFGEYNITPPLGIEMEGYDQRAGVAATVHDPLLARAIVFDDGDTACAVVVADVISLTAGQYTLVGRLAEHWTGIPRRQVIAAGTHTHGGPSVAARPGRSRSPNRPYSELLPHLLASAIRMAWDQRRASTLVLAEARTRDLTINRREPGGTTDEQLTILGIKRGGRLCGALLNYACHGVVLGPDNLALTGDWIGLTRAALAADHPGLFSLITVAPSANINPLPAGVRRQITARGAGLFTNDPFSGIYDRTGGTFAEAERMAGAIAGAARRSLECVEPLASTPGVAATTVTPDIGRGRRRLPAPQRLLRVGGAVLIGMPGEQFVETGARVKQVVREEGLVPIVFTHSPDLAYVPTPEAFALGLANDYEVDWARGMGMAEDAADREVAAIRRGLRKLAGP